MVYGAGNIGRGFIGQIFSQSGYAICFIDVADSVIEALNREGRYPVRILGGNSSEDIRIEGVSAVDGRNKEDAAKAIAEADIMATAVGVRILPLVAPVIAAGLKKRFARSDNPLNIIICENLIDADKVLGNLIKDHLDEKERAIFDMRVGLVKASIGRMVPLQTAEMQAGNALRICVEAYGFLPVDKAAFKGEIPSLTGMRPFDNFDFYIQRKLFIHNMGHAVCAYLGDLRYYTFGYDFIWQAIENPHIKEITKKAMECSALALSKIYNVDINDLIDDIDNLLRRFENRALGDTVKRVGNDLKRKLSPNDRIVGAYKICVEHHLPVNCFCLAIAAAVNFRDDKLSGQGLDNILKEAGSYDLLAENHEHFTLIKTFDEAIKSGSSLKDLCDMIS